MSTRPTKEGLMKWVDDYAVAADLGPCEALVLTKFAAFADAGAQAWAAVKTLAERGRCSERKLQYVLRDFEAQGVIRRTGETYRLPGSTREVPMYAFVGYLASLDEGFADATSMGAQRAPIAADGCTDRGGMGAHTVHPHKEPIEPTPSDEGERARELAFGRLEGAYPKRGLGFTHRARARAEFWKLADEGVDAELLIAATAAFASDRAVKRTDQGLDHWLADRKYRGWWPEPQLALEVAAGAGAKAEPMAGAAPEADQAVWRGVVARLANGMNDGEFGSYIRPCELGASGGLLYVVALTGYARDWIKARAWRRVTNAWAEADKAGRPLMLVSKPNFEALLSAKSAGV